jgi:predicted metal-dependent hydrolase
VPAGSPDAVPGVPEAPLPPEQALDLAQALLDAGRAFGAHEVLEAVWKARPVGQRDERWQGLAQLCVAVTHAQRGNVRGAVRLLRRGAARVGEPLASWALAEADRLESGDRALPLLRLRGS